MMPGAMHHFNGSGRSIAASGLMWHSHEALFPRNFRETRENNARILSKFVLYKFRKQKHPKNKRNERGNWVQSEGSANRVAKVR